MKTLLISSFCFSLLFLGACGGESGSLSAQLNTSAMSNPEDITHYVAGISGNEPNILVYPSKCLECSGGESGCSASQKCIKQNCGFEPSGPFSLDVTFGNFSSGASIEVTVCALDSGSTYLGFAQSITTNTDGEDVSLIMQNDSGECIQIMPPLCS